MLEHNYSVHFFDKDASFISQTPSLAIEHWQGDLMSSVIGTLSPSLLQASLPLCQHFLANCIHQDRSLHASSPLVPLSVSHPVPHYQMKGKPWCLWGWLAAAPEVERWEERGRADEGKEKEWGREQNKAQPALTVNGVRKGEFVLAAWLVSVRALWEGNWRTTVVELLVRSRTKLKLRVSKSHWNHWIQTNTCCRPSAILYSSVWVSSVLHIRLKIFISDWPAITQDVLLILLRGPLSIIEVNFFLNVALISVFTCFKCWLCHQSGYVVITVQNQVPCISPTQVFTLV